MRRILSYIKELVPSVKNFNTVKRNFPRFVQEYWRPVVGLPLAVASAVICLSAEPEQRPDAIPTAVMVFGQVLLWGKNDPKDSSGDGGHDDSQDSSGQDSSGQDSSGDEGHDDSQDSSGDEGHDDSQDSSDGGGHAK